MKKKLTQNVINTSATQWPEPEYDREREPHFLFIITPPYSGSTAIAMLLNTSERTTILHQKAEGQWLIPGMCQSDRWEIDKPINYNSIKSTWLNKYQEITQSERVIDVVIEKSPPNMIRIMELSSCFKSSSCIANNRNPYANCASILYRHYDADNTDTGARKVALSLIAEIWKERSQTIQILIEKYGIPLVTYEEFCTDPASLITKLNLPQGVIETINKDADVKVKDYSPQKVSNHNEKQISKLTMKEIEHLTNIFSESTGLLDKFGYQLI